MNCSIRGLLIFLLLVLPLELSLNLFSTSSFGTSFIAQPFSVAVQEAPIIARGKVGMHYTQWARDEQGTQRIYTYYELQVVETLKGNPPLPSTIMMRELGGEKDGVGLQVSGAAEFHIGEEVVVFLQPKNQDGTYDVHGMMMGKLNILSDSEGEEYLSGPSLISIPSEDHSDKKRWTLSALRRLIEEQGPKRPSSSESTSPSPVPPSQTPSDQQLEPVPSPSAPRLQPSTEKEPPSSRGYRILIGIIIGTIAAGLVSSKVLHRKKNNSGPKS